MVKAAERVMAKLSAAYVFSGGRGEAAYALKKQISGRGSQKLLNSGYALDSCSGEHCARIARGGRMAVR